MDDSVPQSSGEYKQCQRCKKWLLANDNYFGKDKRRKDGRYAWCKVCVREYQRNLPPPIEPLPGTMKCCTKCKQMFPATREFFHGDKARKDGLYSCCKTCKNTTEKVIVTDESRKICGRCKRSLPATREYFTSARNRPDGLYPTCKECVQSDKCEPITDENVMRTCMKCLREYPSTSQYFYINRRGKGGFDSYCIFCKRLNYTKYQEKYRDHVAELVRQRQIKRRARKLAVLGTYTLEQIQEQLKRQKYRCYYAACGHARFKKVRGKYIYHVEHTYPLSRVSETNIPANDASYLVLACPACNLAKGSKYPWEWLGGGRLL